jgi:hypothetical protein
MATLFSSRLFSQPRLQLVFSSQNNSYQRKTSSIFIGFGRATHPCAARTRLFRVINTLPDAFLDEIGLFN